MTLGKSSVVVSKIEIYEHCRTPGQSRQEYVGRAYISMDHPIRVGTPDGTASALKDCQTLLFRKLPSFQRAAEVTAWNQWHGEPDVRETSGIGDARPL